VLTPDDILHKKFTTSRLSKGYDQGEVDAFLDEVTSDYALALQSVADLRAKLAATVHAASAQADVAKAAVAAASAPATVVLPKVAPAPVAVEGPSLDSIRLLLENAQRTADQLIGEATVKAAQVKDEASRAAAATTDLAKTGATKLHVDAEAEVGRLMATALADAKNATEAATGEAQKLIGEAQAEAQKLSAAATAARHEAIGALETQREALEQKVNGLRLTHATLTKALTGALESHGQPVTT
jgi:DivIVA domain-containing protein